MSAGNIVLSSAFYSPTVFPYSVTVLAIGNYWIEEIDFIMSYATTSAVSANAIQIALTAGGTFWIYELFIQSAAAATIIYNTPIICRPRIFLPRGNSVVLNTSNPLTPPVSNIAFSINLYGRTLP